MLAVVGLAIAYLAGGFTGTEEVPPTDTTPSASPTTVRTYDVDADGSADYAVIEDEVVSARDSDGDDSSLDRWLSFTGIVLAALLGAGATVMAGWLNRDVANAVNEVDARIERLEGGA